MGAQARVEHESGGGGRTKKGKSQCARVPFWF